MILRRKLLVFLCFGLLPLMLKGVDQAPVPMVIEDIHWVYRKDDDFKGIVEAIREQETQLDRVIVRSDAHKREGLYLIIKFNRWLSTIPEASRIQITFIISPALDDQTCELSLEYTGHFIFPQNELWVGLTDEAFLGQLDDSGVLERVKEHRKGYLTAWQAHVFDPDGKCIGYGESYAW
ncbi:MAG: hypothetical protein MJ218_03340 [Opitutales bacterium]|nr:hypothetical protein [Opitutales bacterium]